MRARSANTPVAGLTLVETMIAFSLVGAILLATTTVLDSARRHHREERASMEIEAQGARTLDRIVDALRVADWGSIAPPIAAPFSTNTVDYQYSLGPEETGLTLWSAPQRVEQVVAEEKIRWSENPGLPEERSADWCSYVPALFEGEVANGIDDNGNGLIDEPGLYFSTVNDALVVGLTLTREKDGGRTWLTRTFQTVLLPRN
jgi:Tfp pilus assembly protein PilV